MPLPQVGQAYTFQISLMDASNPLAFIETHTFEEGDVKVSVDGGATFTNLTNLPTMANSVVVVELTDAEMDSETYVTIRFDDQTVPNVWIPMRVEIPLL